MRNLPPPSSSLMPLSPRLPASSRPPSTRRLSLSMLLSMSLFMAIGEQVLLPRPRARRRRAAGVAACLLLAIGVTALAAAVAGCRADSSEPPRARVRLTSGTAGAGFRRLSQALAIELRQRLPDVDFEVHETAGALNNIEAIQRGDADVGLSHADVTYLAFVGHLDDGAAPFGRLRGIAMLHAQQVHLVVGARSGIRRIEDLRGRRVSVGRGGVTSTAGLVLNAVGIPTADGAAQALPYAEAAARLTSGELDAFFVTGGDPLDAVTVATRAGARLLPLEGAIIDRLRADYPFFRRAVIPAGTYPGQREPVHTIGVDSVLLCRDDVPEALVHEMTRQLFEILPALAARRLVTGRLDIEQAPATPIPLHDGAARYYREQELSR